MAKSPPERYPTDLPTVVVDFDTEAFDEAIRSHGARLVHWRGMKCPVGMVDEFDTRRPHEDHSGCSNGFLYTKAGAITCLFTGNGTRLAEMGLGNLDGSTVQVTAPRHYDGTETPVYVAPFDRFYLDEEHIVVVDWQTYRHNPAGQDKLNFPAVTVHDLVDSRNRRYVSGQDFEVREGRLNWLTGNRPGVDPETGRGLVCSVRYTYRPYWYCKQLMHEVRITQSDNPYGEGPGRTVQRMPQAFLLTREFVFEKNERDSQAPDKDRQVPAPEGIRFGARF